jgi:hypothetical protein
LQQRHELAEMRRPFYGRGFKAKTLCLGIIVQGLVAVIGLRRQHLTRRA